MIVARCYLQEVDDAELEAFAREHIAYELWMLVQTAVYLRNTPMDASQVERNALLESFALHARVLGDFLANKNGGHGDVLACMYAETWHGNSSWTDYLRRSTSRSRISRRPAWESSPSLSGM